MTICPPAAVPRIAALVVGTSPVLGAAPFVYEGFEYHQVGDELIGKPDDAGGSDAIGLTGTWADAAATSGPSNDMFLKAGNLEFGDLARAGNHIGFRNNLNNDRYSRPLTQGARGVIEGSGEIWFSFLVEKLQNNFNAGEGGFALANQTLGSPRVFENGGNTALDGLAGFGCGPTTAGDDWTAYAWDGESRVTGDAAIAMPPANGASNTDGSNLGDVRLIVGQLTFDIGADGKDRYALYDFQLNGGSVAGGELIPIASPLEVDVDQGSLGTLNLTRQVNLNYDEVRIGTSFGDVVPGAAGPPFAIDAVEFSPATGTVTLTWGSREGESFAVKFSTDLTNWDADLDDGIDADAGASTTRSFDISGLAAGDGELYFRVERN